MNEVVIVIAVCHIQDNVQEALLRERDGEQGTERKAKGKSEESIGAKRRPLPGCGEFVSCQGLFQ
jgi:hypothetical protein